MPAPLCRAHFLSNAHRLDPRIGVWRKTRRALAWIHATAALPHRTAPGAPGCALSSARITWSATTNPASVQHPHISVLLHRRRRFARSLVSHAAPTLSARAPSSAATRAHVAVYAPTPRWWLPRARWTVNADHLSSVAPRLMGRVFVRIISLKEWVAEVSPHPLASPLWCVITPVGAKERARARVGVGTTPIVWMASSVNLLR